MYTVTRAARISRASLEREFLKDAAVPSNSLCTVAGMCRSVTALSMAVIAEPSASRGARLNEMVTAGTWPWRLMESGAVVCSKCVNALSGTALPDAEVGGLIVEVVEFVWAFPMGLIALDCAASTPGDGEYSTAVVIAFEPADAEPEAAKELVAPGPVAPDEAFDWMYMAERFDGSRWN